MHIVNVLYILVYIVKINSLAPTLGVRLKKKKNNANDSSVHSMRPQTFAYSLWLVRKA